MTDFKLDPPRGGKSQAALITIRTVLEESNELPTSFLVETVQLLSADEVSRMIPVMRKMIYFTSLGLQMADRKCATEGWSEIESPAKAARCRTLGRSSRERNFLTTHFDLSHMVPRSSAARPAI